MSRRRGAVEQKKENKDEKTQEEEKSKYYFNKAGQLYAILFIFRAANALIVNTFFNPDEYWQSLEIAHRIVFGYGYETWEWKEGLRSYLHPLIFASLYKILQLLNLDHPLAIIVGPRIVQAAFAALGDLFLFKLAWKLYDEQTAKWTLFCSVSNWFMFYCIVRTFSNSLETNLITVFMYYWSLSANHIHNRRLALIIAAITFIVRPTSALLFGFIGLRHLKSLDSWSKRFQFIAEVAIIGVAAMSICVAIDWYFYGRFVLVPWNFINFNVMKGGSAFYGVHPFHWYFTQGFVAIVGPFLPFFIHGVYVSTKNKKDYQLFWIILWVNVAMSFLAHKEFRFVLPVLPFALLYAGYSLRVIDSSKRVLWVIALILINVFAAIFLSCMHQMGPVSVMGYVRRLDTNSSVHFLMPCHSTPFYSHVHKNITMKFWDCSPNFTDPNYLDEAERFKMDPLGFVENYYDWNGTSPDKAPLPTHFIMFDRYLDALQDFFSRISYTKSGSWLHKVYLEGFQIKRERIVAYTKSAS